MAGPPAGVGASHTHRIALKLRKSQSIGQLGFSARAFFPLSVVQIV